MSKKKLGESYSLIELRSKKKLYNQVLKFYQFMDKFGKTSISNEILIVFKNIVERLNLILNKYNNEEFFVIENNLKELDVLIKKDFDWHKYIFNEWEKVIFELDESSKVIHGLYEICEYLDDENISKIEKELREAKHNNELIEIIKSDFPKYLANQGRSSFFVILGVLMVLIPSLSISMPKISLLNMAPYYFWLIICILGGGLTFYFAAPFKEFRKDGILYGLITGLCIFLSVSFVSYYVYRSGYINSIEKTLKNLRLSFMPIALSFVLGALPGATFWYSKQLKNYVNYRIDELKESGFYR